MIRALAVAAAFGLLSACTERGDLIFSFDWIDGFQAAPEGVTLDRARGRAAPVVSKTNEAGEVVEVDAYADLRARVDAGELTQAQAVAELRRLEQAQFVEMAALDTGEDDSPATPAMAPTRETDGTQASTTTRRAIGTAQVRAGAETPVRAGAEAPLRAGAQASLTCEDGSSAPTLADCPAAAEPVR